MSTEPAEGNFLDFTCPHCGELNSFPADAAGHVRECMNCMESVIVPEPGDGAGRPLPLPITTPRLVLRRLVADDWKDLLGFMWEDEEDAARWLANDRKVKLTSVEQTFNLGVEVRDTGKVVGCVSLKFTDGEFIEAELSAEGKHDPDSGIAVEAVDALLGFCFKGIKLHRVIARAGGGDAGFCNLLEDAGMRREGEFVKNYRVNGEWQNTIWFAMLDEEYRAVASDRAG